jgi:DNA-binding Lrp family transcriptional regulator
MADPLDAQILERLRADGPATGPEVAAAVDAHPATVSRRCDALQRAGRLRQATGGVYVVTERGTPVGWAASD